jgi:hypothetical protein
MYSLDRASGFLNQGGYRVEFDGIKYPFISTTAAVLSEAVEEFKESRHYVAGHPLQDIVYVTRFNTFGDPCTVWEVDMVSGHFKIDQTFLGV